MKVRNWNGKPVSMPGIISGMDIQHYHSAKACVEPSISSSAICEIFRSSLKHYWDTSVYNPNAQKREVTDAMMFGSAVHHLAFSQPDFKKQYVMRPDTINGEAWHGNKNICKAWLKEQEANGLTIITRDQLERIKAIAVALLAHPFVQHGGMNGEIETSYIWKDQETGIWMKARPDARPTGSLDFSDLKVTHSVHPAALQHTIEDRQHFIQAAMSAIACRELLGQEMNSFTLFFVEANRPYDVWPRAIKPHEIEAGERAIRAIVRRFAHCLKSGNWPGYGEDKRDGDYIEMRQFARQKVENRIEELGGVARKFENGVWI